MLSDLTRLDKEVLACLPVFPLYAYTDDVGKDVYNKPIGKPLGVPKDGLGQDARRSILKLRRLLARAVGEKPLDAVPCTHTDTGIAYSLSKAAHAYVVKNAKKIWATA